MKPTTLPMGDKELRIKCNHENVFPPVAAILEGENYGPPVQQRADGVITETDFSQYNIWKNVCGIMEMGTKCLGCAHCQKVETDPQGNEKVSPLRPEVVRAMPFYRKINKGNL